MHPWSRFLASLSKTISEDWNRLWDCRTLCIWSRNKRNKRNSMRQACYRIWSSTRHAYYVLACLRDNIWGRRDSSGAVCGMACLAENTNAIGAETVDAVERKLKFLYDRMTWAGFHKTDTDYGVKSWMNTKCDHNRRTKQKEMRSSFMINFPFEPFLPPNKINKSSRQFNLWSHLI